MRANKINKLIDKHILECIRDFEDNNFKTIEDACKHMYSEFNRVANHEYNIRRFPNVQDRFQDYLMGVPFGFYFYYSDMREFFNEIGMSSRGTNEQIVKKYCYLIFDQMKKRL